ncbi:hypothetical protein K435DRAFT_777654, partial [Dendrothele bispora CBS 962.96]
VFRQTAPLAARKEAREALNRDGQPMKMLQPPTSGGRTGGRRNPGRMDGMAWKADSFICPQNVGNILELEGAPQILEYEEDLLKADIENEFMIGGSSVAGLNLYHDDFAVITRASTGNKMSYAAVLKTKG